MQLSVPAGMMQWLPIQMLVCTASHLRCRSYGEVGSFFSFSADLLAKVTSGAHHRISDDVWHAFKVGDQCDADQ